MALMISFPFLYFVLSLTVVCGGKPGIGLGYAFFLYPALGLWKRGVLVR